MSDNETVSTTAADLDRVTATLLLHQRAKALAVVEMLESVTRVIRDAIDAEEAAHGN